MERHSIMEETTRRVVWEFDEYHETRESYGYNTEEKTSAAENEELRKLESGEWVALCAQVFERAADCPCPECTGWHTVDTLGGIVIESDEAKLREFAVWNEWLPKGSKEETK